MNLFSLDNLQVVVAESAASVGRDGMPATKMVSNNCLAEYVNIEVQRAIQH